METVIDKKDRLWLILDQSEDKDTSRCAPPISSPSNGLYVLSMVVNPDSNLEFLYHDYAERFDTFKLHHKGAFRNFPWRIYQLLL